LVVSALLVVVEPALAQMRTVTIGVIGKIESNPVFQASYAGARLAAKEAGQKFGVQVTIDWQTPKTESAAEQAATVRRLAKSGVSGIAISATDAVSITPAIDEAIESGIAVVCFDSDAPKSKRLAYIGVDDVEFGRAIMRQLSDAMGGQGTVAILAGNQQSLNLRLRLQGIKEEAAQHPKLLISPELTFEHAQTYEPAIEIINRTLRTRKDVDGWAFIGSWPLQRKNSLSWAPGTIKAVAGNAVPEELAYVKSGHVQSLVGVNAFQLGYSSVIVLLDKAVNGVPPQRTLIQAPLVRVDRSNVDEWELNWKKWLLREALNR
jgi:ribose transport system substrate-binding protein